MEPTTSPDPSPVPPSPFQPGAPRSGRGCSKPALIGCGALLVLLGVCAVVFMVKAPSMLRWVFDRVERQVLAQAAPDVTPEEKARLQKAFDDAASAVASDKADPLKAQQLNRVLMEVGQPGRRATKEDVRRLTEALEAMAGKEKTPDAVPETPETPRAP
jgi:hypothetical protein